MESQFQTLINSYENAKLHHEESKVKMLGTGVSITISIFRIEVPFKNHLIKIKNEFGTINSATVEMKIEQGIIPEFIIESRNHLQNLFSLKKKRFTVKCDDLQYKSMIEEAILSSGMDKIAKENLFEPIIKVENNSGVQSINTRYHLQFNDKINGIKALIDFYKILIERL